MTELEGEIIFGKKDNYGKVSKNEKSETKTQKEFSVPQAPDRLAEKEEKRTYNKVRFYTSICKNPKGIFFNEQDHDEHIILLMRRSFVVNLPWIFSVVILAFLPFLLPFLPFPFETGNIHPFMYVVGFAFYYLILFGVGLVNFTLWYFNIGFLTNKRLIDIDLHGVLVKQVAETRISLLQDVSFKQSGFMSSFFGHGDVFVQTAGSNQNLEFDRVPKPGYISEVIGDLIGSPYLEHN